MNNMEKAAAALQAGGQSKAWPVMSREKAQALLTAPGAPFEMEEVEVDGRPVSIWKHGPRSLVDLFEQTRDYSDREFLVYQEERVTYEAFRRASYAFARELIDRGVKPGDRVAIAMRNLPEWPVVFFGIVLAGGVATALNAWWLGNELAYGLSDSGAVAAVFDFERYERTKPYLDEDGALQTVFVSRAPEPPTGVSALEDVIGRWDSWNSLPEAEGALSKPSPDDFATIFYTSGTTGNPKGALATHRAVTMSIFGGRFGGALALLMSGQSPPSGPPAKRCAILSVPFFHVTGCFASLFGGMYSGAKIVLMRKFDAEEMMRIAEAEGANSIGGVPTILTEILRSPSLGRYDLSSVENVNYGGAPPTPGLLDRLNECMPAATVGTGWGMTETCAAATLHMGQSYIRRPDSCGLTIPVNKLKVVDEEGKTLPPGEIGELCAYGAQIISRYWNKPEATASAINDGWLRTGDLARIDEEGYCYLVDRLKDVIIRGGENIYSVEVEKALVAHPAVAEAALVAIPDPVLGELPGAIVVLNQDMHTDSQELREFVRGRLAAFKVPASIAFRDEPLPRNAGGKILKTELKQVFQTDVEAGG